MSIFVKKLSPDAYLPLKCDNYFILLAPNDFKLESGEIRRIDVNIEMRILNSMYPIIVSNEDTYARNIHIPTFSNLNYTEKYKSGETIGISFNIKNDGKNSAEFKKGDKLARLILLRSIVCDIKEVTDFNEIPMIDDRIKQISKTPYIWFGKIYRNEPIIAKKMVAITPQGAKIFDYIDAELVKQKDYLDSNDKPTFLFNYIWDNMPVESKNKINEEFNVYKTNILNE